MLAKRGFPFIRNAKVETVCIFATMSSNCPIQMCANSIRNREPGQLLDFLASSFDKNIRQAYHSRRTACRHDKPSSRNGGRCPAGRNEPVHGPRGSFSPSVHCRPVNRPPRACR
jgi:hypothetical protein